MLHKKAVALKYASEQQRAPKVIAKGSGAVAKRIIERAKEFEVPLFANKELVDSLLSLELDEQIPPQLYQAVAEVFLWLIDSERKAQESI